MMHRVSSQLETGKALCLQHRKPTGGRLGRQVAAGVRPSRGETRLGIGDRQAEGAASEAMLHNGAEVNISGVGQRAIYSL